MKWFVVAWLFTAGIGMSYSIAAERNKKIHQLVDMEQSLKRLAYYMFQWHLPVKEAIAFTAKEENEILRVFYNELQESLEQRKSEDFSLLWRENGARWFENVPEEIRILWMESFENIPLESETLYRRLSERAQKMKEFTQELQQKYKGEQKIVFTMGVFVSAFLCLILW